MYGIRIPYWISIAWLATTNLVSNSYVLDLSVSGGRFKASLLRNFGQRRAGGWYRWVPGLADGGRKIAGGWGAVLSKSPKNVFLPTIYQKNTKTRGSFLSWDFLDLTNHWQETGILEVEIWRKKMESGRIQVNLWWRRINILKRQILWMIVAIAILNCQRVCTDRNTLSYFDFCSD